MVYDFDYYLWMKLSNDKEAFVGFTDMSYVKKWLAIIIHDFQMFGDKKKIILTLLKFFEKMHWIEIENEKEICFRFRFLTSHNTKERTFLLDFMKQYGKIIEIEDKFCFEL